MNEEDSREKLEVLKNTKDYLIEQIKANEEKMNIQERDINTLKKLLEIEKKINQKEAMRIGELERELREERTRHDEKETEIRDKVNELETKLREKERNLQMLSVKYSEIKQHKKVLKGEVLNLMDQLRSSEFKLQNSETTVNSISEFFTNNTLLKLEKLKERKNKNNNETEYAQTH